MSPFNQKISLWMMLILAASLFLTLAAAGSLAALNQVLPRRPATAG